MHDQVYPLKCAFSRASNEKFFEEGATPSPIGRRKPPPRTHPRRRLRCLHLAPPPNFGTTGKLVPLLFGTKLRPWQDPKRFRWKSITRPLYIDQNSTPKPAYNMQKVQFMWHHNNRITIIADMTILTKCIIVNPEWSQECPLFFSSMLGLAATLNSVYACVAVLSSSILAA